MLRFPRHFTGKARPAMTDLQHLLVILDQAYDHRSWHGTNLRGSIRGLSPEQAAWRPAAGRHNIWELVVHSAYWKYAARRRLTGEPRHVFPARRLELVSRGRSRRPEKPGGRTSGCWTRCIARFAPRSRTAAAVGAASQERPRSGHELLAHRRRGGARSLSRGSDSVVEKTRVCVRESGGAKIKTAGSNRLRCVRRVRLQADPATVRLKPDTTQNENPL